MAPIVAQNKGADGDTALSLHASISAHGAYETQSTFWLLWAGPFGNHPDRKRHVRMTPLFHITHVDNLPRIISAGGLCCDRIQAERSVQCVGIAHQHIKERRKVRAVRTLSGRVVAAGGTLWDYVPFYFAPQSPMLFTINQGNVEGYRDGQKPILHLATSAETLAGLGKPFAFTNGHAEMSISDFGDDLSQLAHFIDQKVMEGKYWNDTIQNPDRKRRRQAEFLLHQFVPWQSIEKVGVIDSGMKLRVEAILEDKAHKPLVVIERGWYY